ncbi:MAG: hypothetical protein GDA56_09505 [Hormoscilla sp. GM7CHS1pb]|nr:hypothetical protein [Hormoscilla sp. GM7CHS1pb]
MNQQLTEMNNYELKQYLSAHRNDAEAFSQALQVALSRREDEAKSYPYPYDMSTEEVVAIFREKLNQKS